MKYLIFVVIFATIVVSEISGQLLNKLKSRYAFSDYGYTGALEPFINSINNKWNVLEDEDPSQWSNTIDDTVPTYLIDNTIDGSNYINGYNDDSSVRYILVSDVIRGTTSKPERRPLTDFLRYDQLKEIFGSRFADKSGYGVDGTLSGRAYNGYNGFAKHSSTNKVNQIPSPMIASKPFRRSTLASIGYGPNFRFY